VRQWFTRTVNCSRFAAIRFTIDNRVVVNGVRLEASRATRLCSLVLVATASLFTVLGAGGSGFAQASPVTVRTPLLRVELHLAPGAYVRAHDLLVTLGGPVYCGLLFPLAGYLDANLLCPDFGRNGEKSGASRNERFEDWGDPAYLEAVARIPGRLRSSGVKISRLVVIGPSYSGFAGAELVATHPQLRPAALIVIDSYFDLPSRYSALPSWHPTRKEIERALGGTLAEKPEVYGSRSPSHHLDGLAKAIRHGTRFLAVWSVAAVERHEFNGATCNYSADAKWVAQLAGLAGRPLVAYVTQMKHADVLRDWGEHLLGLAHIGPAFTTPLPARAVTFRPGHAAPAGSYCR
jgi:pimeloyl-ACP methyl ester carboxylesterase